MLKIENFNASEGRNQPLYLRISQWIEDQIADGTLNPGQRLQPVRKLSEQLGVNRGAVAHAYNSLINRGVLEGSSGRGTFVATSPGNTHGKSPAPAIHEFWQPVLAETDTRFGARGASSVEIGEAVDWVPEYGVSSGFNAQFVMDLPLADHRLSYSIVRSALTKISKSLLSDALTYGHPQGLPALRMKLARLGRHHGVDVEPDNILICNGTQQALSLCSALLIQPGDAVVMAEPGYSGAARVFRMCGARILTVSADDYGLSNGRLQEIIKNHRPKVMYVVPTFHAPTGVTLPLERRRELYEIAETYGIPIFEDEYVNSLYYEEPPPLPIKSLDRRGLVIYAGTFSKTLSAGFRLGWIAAHPSLVSRLIQAKEAQDIHSSMITQLLVDDLLKGGLYEKHLGELREHYGVRYRALLDALHKYFGDSIVYNRPGGGFSIWVTLPRRISTSRWLHFSRIRGVNFHNGSSYFVGGAQDKYAQLSFGHIDPNHISLAVEQLFLAYQDAQRAQLQERPKIGWFKPFS